MKLFYHHVGQQGADEDFPKTVFQTRLISEVQEAVLRTEPLKATLMTELQARFPAGSFNCWGVPSGADRVIGSLAPGDVVLLIESAHITGRVPALCQVEVFLPHEFPSLSARLWGSHKYPFVFFFKTEQINLQWIQLLDHLGYAENFDPRGMFYSVADSRLERYGGPEGYVELLRTKFASQRDYPLVDPEDVRRSLRDQTAQYIARVNSEILKLQVSSSESDPRLTGDARQSKRVSSLATTRDQAFRLGIRQLYDSTCAICASRLLTPEGSPETQAAHIYPKRLDGADDFRNGVCLCRIHHWALDAGWISLGDDQTILGRRDIPTSDDFSVIRRFVGTKLRPPLDSRFRPHRLFLQAHRELHGFAN